jgi:hypothetical protein
VYEPNGDQRGWALGQMDDARLPQPIKTAVIRLLDVWWTQNHTKQTFDLTLTTFDALARGHALAPKGGHDERWAVVKPGGIVRGEQVRVRFDAYSGPAGEAHNGRRGRVVALRQGDVIVKYDDKRQPPGDGVHHSPFVLEKLL